MSGVKGMNGGGGRRPGAGRKKKDPGEKKVQVTITITREQLDELYYLKEKSIDMNVMIGREIHRLAVAYELAEAGIE